MGKRALLPDLWIIAALFSLNLLILGPYLLTDFPNQPWNNGYMYIGMARAFHEYGWGWNPSTYGGAPLGYLYPPIFPALLGAIPVASLGRAYHLLTGAAYALTPVGIYVLGLQLFQSRLLGGFAAVLYSAFPSPAYYFLPLWKNLAQPYANAPWGYLALIGYEEAPHGFALLFLLLAIAAAWRNHWTWAAFLTAIVMLISWPGLIGLGMALAAIGVAKVRERGIPRILGTLGTGYGLAAFWITPGFFLSITLLNRVVLRHTNVAEPWNRTTWAILAAAAMLVVISTWRRMRPAIALLLAWLAIVGAVVLSYTFAGNSVLPLPHRYMLEFNVCTVLAIAGLISLAPKFRPLLVAAVLLAGAPGAIHFLRHAWSVQPVPQRPQASAGYPIVQWLKGNGAGSGRIMASGEVEPELSVWSDLPQVGGSGQGVSNPLTFAAQRQIAFGCGAESERIAELWMRALHVEYFIAHGADSQEYFHWIAEPEKFSVLPAVWQSGHGDTIYRARNFDGREAVVVDLDELKRLPQMASTGDIRFLEAYVAWAAGKRPASIHWNDAGSADVDADLGADEGILIKTNYDAGWRVGEAATGSDPIGFLLIRGRQGPRHLRLRFGRSWDGWLGIAITGMTIILVSLRVPGVWIAAAAVLPAGVAWLFLASSVPPTAGLAEQAFMRLQPPMINPQGIVDAATNAQPPFTPGRVIAMYGLKFGGAKDSVVVRAGDRAAEIVYRGENQVNFKMPAGAAGDVPVSVEVNGCRGNSFGVAVR